MLDENALAKVICRANLQRKIDALQAAGDISGALLPGVKAMLERDVAKRWQAYLPEARAVKREFKL